MAGCRVFSVGFKGALTIAADGFVRGGKLCKGANVAKAKTLKIWQMNRSRFENMPYGVSTGITPICGIRHFTDPGRVKNDQADTPKVESHMKMIRFEVEK